MAFTIKNPTAPATPAQVNFYGKLAVKAQKMIQPDIDTEQVFQIATVWAEAHNKGEVSKAIDGLKKATDGKTAAKPKTGTPAVEPGYYAIGNDVFTVVISKYNKPYAKVWALPEGAAKASWAYAPGAIFKIADAGATKMTLEEAKTFGHLHGHCIRCGALLTDPVSVEAGIGPTCQKYEFWG